MNQRQLQLVERAIEILRFHPKLFIKTRTTALIVLVNNGTSKTFHPCFQPLCAPYLRFLYFTLYESIFLLLNGTTS